MIERYYCTQCGYLDDDLNSSEGYCSGMACPSCGLGPIRPLEDDMNVKDIPTAELAAELKRREEEANATKLKHLLVKRSLMSAILAGSFGNELRDAFFADAAECFSGRRLDDIKNGNIQHYRMDFTVHEARGCYGDQG